MHFLFCLAPTGLVLLFQVLWAVRPSTAVDAVTVSHRSWWAFWLSCAIGEEHWAEWLFTLWLWNSHYHLAVLQHCFMGYFLVFHLDSDNKAFRFGCYGGKLLQEEYRKESCRRIPTLVGHCFLWSRLLITGYFFSNVTHIFLLRFTIGCSSGKPREFAFAVCR